MTSCNLTSEILISMILLQTQTKIAGDRPDFCIYLIYDLDHDLDLDIWVLPFLIIENPNIN